MYSENMEYACEVAGRARQEGYEEGYEDGYDEGRIKALKVLERYHLDGYRKARRTYGERMREGKEWGIKYHKKWAEIHSFGLWSVRYDMEKDVSVPACQYWSIP